MQNTKKIGIIVKDLSPSYLSFCLIDMINKQVEETPDYDFIIFYENRYPNPLDVLCSTMSSSEIWNFDGTLISTTAANTMLSINAIAPKKKFFYVWDLEWCRPHGKGFDYMIQAYNNKGVDLIARSEDHAKAIKNYCNRDVCGIVTDFNMDQLMEIIK